jgi:peptide/nickel transport system permease protein
MKLRPGAAPWDRGSHGNMAALPAGPGGDAAELGPPRRAWRVLSLDMRRLALRRISLMIPAAVLASIGIFILIRLVPGGPAVGILGIHASAQSIAALNQQLGLDQPLVTQYWHWLTGAVTGNLGDSLQTQQPVTHMVAESFPVSAELVVLALLFTVIFAFPVGVFAAMRADTRLDRVMSSASGLGLAVPDFFLAVILIAIFGIAAHLLPELGFVPFAQSPAANLEHMVLPSLSMGLGAAAIIVRQVRAAMIDALRAPHIRTARAMGLAERSVVWRYALRNALPTILNVYGLLIVGMFGATLIIEEVFVLPGMGNALINAIGVRDYTFIQGVTMVYVMLVLVVNLVVDLAVATVSPKLVEQ